MLILIDVNKLLAADISWIDGVYRAQMGLVPVEFETDDLEKELSASSQNVTDFSNTSFFILGPYFLPHPP